MKSVIFIIFIVLLSGCSDNKEALLPVENESPIIPGQITMTTEGTGVVYIYMAGAKDDSVTINWGDGTPSEKYRLWKFHNFDNIWSGSMGNAYRYEHRYAGTSACTITIISDNIMFLYCNRIMSLDVRSSTTLKYLGCIGNQLKYLDVSRNTELIHLACPNNQLTNLDVSKNTKLEYLDCANNQLTNLDVSKNTAMTWLQCSRNQLTSLDVNAATTLRYLHCSNNQLESLDVSANTKLDDLDCSNNQLTSLDVSDNTALRYLYCDNNQLTNLDASASSIMWYLHCSGNNLTSLKVTNSEFFSWLICSSNQLSTASLNALFGKLHDKTGFKRINITNNPGTDNCDQSIATDKGWTIEND